MANRCDLAAYVAKPKSKRRSDDDRVAVRKLLPLGQFSIDPNSVATLQIDNRPTMAIKTQFAMPTGNGCILYLQITFDATTDQEAAFDQRNRIFAA